MSSQMDKHNTREYCAGDGHTRPQVASVVHRESAANDCVGAWDKTQDECVDRLWYKCCEHQISSSSTNNSHVLFV